MCIMTLFQQKSEVNEHQQIKANRISLNCFGYGNQKKLCRTNSLQRSIEKQKALKVRFYRNGDHYHQGLVYVVSSARFRTFEALLVDLTNRLADKVNLPHGVRYVFTADGARKINQIQELEQGGRYVCASSDVFKKIAYGVKSNPDWCVNVRTGSSTSIRFHNQRNNSMVMGHVDEMRTCVSHESLSHSLVTESSRQCRDFIRPKLITVVRSGIKPRKVVRILLNKKTVHSLEQVLSDVTKAIKLDSGSVRKLYTLSGMQVSNLQDFFGSDDVFIAYGYEKPSPDDFNVGPEEARVVQPYSKQPSSVSLRGDRVLLQRKSSLQVRKTLSPSTGCCTTGPQQQAAARRRTQSMRKQRCNSTRDTEGTVNDRVTQTRGVRLATTEDGGGLPTQVSERYSVGDRIGDGTYAIVHECFERSTGNKFALKIINKAKYVGKEKMLTNEVELLRRVRHRNVIRLFHDFHSDGDIYLILELINGGDLFDAIASQSRYTEQEASGMLGDLASALSYLHKLRIVHRDVKPENLLICIGEKEKKTLKLGDFGLATFMSGPLYTVCGTPTYVAPEIIIQTGYDFAVDVWAAGVITYILLCGYPPFRSSRNDQEEIFDSILAFDLQFPPAHWSRVSEEAVKMIRQILEPDPNRRLSADQLLQHSWLRSAKTPSEDRRSAVEPSPFRRNLSLRASSRKKKPLVDLERY